MAGWRWLFEEKGFQFIKLARNSKSPIRGESYENPVWRSFESVNLDRNANAGVLTGRISGIIGLDIDNELLFPPEYEVPDTLTVKTNKGFHHYFKLPDDGKDYRCRRKGDIGFDIRCNGGYLVAPWSKHPDGPLYTLVEDAEIEDAPQWLLDLSEETESTPSSTSSLRVTVPSLITISEPIDFTFPPVNRTIIEEATSKGKRSERIWHILLELVELECAEEDILWIFESNPSGIGEKYFEKGAGRYKWLLTQVAKARDELARRYADPVVANDQESVNTLTEKIRNFIRGNGLYVTDEHEQSIRDFVNLLISLYEGSISGWYAVPIPVGGGKTQTILHFIKFLYEHDAHRTFPISVAFEKISEIERAASWLQEKSVPGDFYQVVHHEVPDISTIFERLPNIPVILHTHQKLSGSSYVNDYFKYNGRIRKLLIFDESMVNAMLHSGSCLDISAKLSTFSREYNVNESFRGQIPSGIFQFFEKLNHLIETKEIELNSSTKKELRLEPDITNLEGIRYGDLIRYSRIIESRLGETDLYRTILLTSCAPPELRKMTLIKGQGKPALFVTKELLDESISNLVTTDASRDFRRLFRYTQRSDGKRIQTYKIPNFRWDDELGIWCYPHNSGKESIKRAFEGDDLENPYLMKIIEIVNFYNENWAIESQMAGANTILAKPKYLFFHSKQITTIPCQIKLKLVEKGLILPSEINERLFFETFGRENATDEYKGCEVIFFIGLLHKPSSAIDALLAGEGFVGDTDAVRQEVEKGEFIFQLQQGIGRGALRRGRRQFVHFFHPQPEIFEDDLRRAFPMCYYNGTSPEGLGRIE